MTISLENVGSGFKRTSINDNFQAIQDEINNNVLTKDGGKALTANLDANSHRILNLQDAVNRPDSVNYGQVQDLIAAASSLTTSDTTIINHNQSGVDYNLSAYLKNRHAANVKDFGALGDGIQDDTSAIQNALNSGATTVLIPAGTYRISSTITLPEGIQVIGEGKKSVVIDGETDGVRVVFVTSEPADTTLTQTVDLNQGSTTHTITNTCQAGDIVRFKSSQRFTRTWDGGVAIRPEYVDGECLLVKSATSSDLTFHTPPVLDFPVASSDTVSFFTPQSGLTISGMTIKTLKDDASYSKGITIYGFTGVRIHDVDVENANDSGIGLYKCFDFDISGCSFIGGSATIGLNYGILVADGSKYGNISNIEGTQCRHVVTGGGSGYAIPMFISVTNCAGYNNQSHDFDAHGNTAYWTFRNLQGIISCSGLGHYVENVKSTKATTSRLAYEGGDKGTFTNITYENSTGMDDNKQLINSTISGLSLTVVNPTALSVFKGGGSTNKYRDIKIINGAYSNTMNETQADATLNASSYFPLYMADDCDVDGLYIEGFASGPSVQGAVQLRNLHLHNVGWTTAFTVAEYTLKLTLDAKFSTIRDVKITYDNLVISNNNRAILLAAETSLGRNGTYIMIDNIRDHSINSAYYSWLIDPAFDYITITNTFVANGGGGSSGTVGANGFSSNNNAAI